MLKRRINKSRRDLCGISFWKTTIQYGHTTVTISKAKRQNTVFDQPSNRTTETGSPQISSVNISRRAHTKLIISWAENSKTYDEDVSFFPSVDKYNLFLAKRKTKHYGGSYGDAEEPQVFLLLVTLTKRANLTLTFVQTLFFLA